MYEQKMTEPIILTDEETIKALKNCNENGRDACDSCPLKEGRCIDLTINALALIYRLQEENGYLKICADEFLAGHNQAQRELEDQEKRIKEMLTKILGFCTDKEVGMIYLIKRTAKEYGVEL